MTATIKDVARAAGVSIATVSHVLNGTHYVSPELCQRVLIAAAEIGYHRNEIARGLRTGRTNLLGLLLPNLETSSFPILVHGVEDVVAAAGYNLVLLRSARASDRDPLDLARRGTLDGVILDMTLLTVNESARLRETEVPIVVIGSRMESEGVDMVVVDEAAGIGLAVGHLVELGHKRIGFVTGSSESQAVIMRHEGYRQALARYGLVYDPAIVAETSGSRYGGYRGAKSVLAASPRPTALLTASETLAAGALLAVRDAGLQVPDDISLVGYDDVHIADLLTPTLTMLSLPWYEIGMRAAKMLLERVSGNEKGSGRTIVLSPKLVWRQSSAAPPASV